VVQQIRTHGGSARVIRLDVSSERSGTLAWSAEELPHEFESYFLSLLMGCWSACFKVAQAPSLSGRPRLHS